MKTKQKLTLLAAGAIMAACSPSVTTIDMSKLENNPLLQKSAAQYEIPEFSKIKYEDYQPALEYGIARQREEINAIVVNRATPDFENTILALDNAGMELAKASAVLGLLTGTDNTDELEAVDNATRSMLTAAGDEIYLNDLLFQKVKQVHDNMAQFNLNTAQRRLVEKYYKRFVRNGALLSQADKDTLKVINQELSEYMQKFGQNIVKETKQTEILVEDKAELAGIPQNTVDDAAAEAVKRGKPGKWVFTLAAPSRLGVLSNADSRDLRRRMYTAYTSLCSNNNEFNNEKNINEILRLRQKKARLLGFNTFADYMLDNVMAKTVKNAEDLLYQIWTPAINKVKEEVADMQAIMDAEAANTTVAGTYASSTVGAGLVSARTDNGDGRAGLVSARTENGADRADTRPAPTGSKIEPWDYYYYAEKVKAAKFNLSDDDIRPYFAIDNVVKGMFYVANRLHGTTFTPLPDAPKYNPEVNVYDVKDKDGKHLAVFMTDYFPRDTKRSGAWMSSLRDEFTIDGVNQRPIVYNVGNMTKPTKDCPSLLTVDEVQTVFHEFGHGMHGMFTTAQYRGQSGTSVDRNMVELPSQINEHWATEPEVLKYYAKHYKTGEVIPDSLIKKIEETGKFNMGFMTTELAAAALLDLEWHKMEYTGYVDVKTFEDSIAKKLNLPKEITYRYRSPYFRHIFASSGYAAGYYTYLWAEVLDADGFELFKEKGIFDQETARKYREYILQPGDSEDAMTLFQKFRGHKPSPEALLRNRGLK